MPARLVALPLRLQQDGALPLRLEERGQPSQVSPLSSAEDGIMDFNRKVQNSIVKLRKKYRKIVPKL